ncbi:MAG: hypothetical protein HKL90_12485 [Elusimicrobia bacterium]|nr:hypothetical protein [Elusimicrobiota bacterium]
MAKKTKKAFVPAAPPPSARMTPEGRVLTVAGGVLVLFGFLALSRADASGRGLAARVCPFLILGGYALVGLGLWRRPPSPPAAR